MLGLRTELEKRECGQSLLFLNRARQMVIAPHRIMLVADEEYAVLAPLFPALPCPALPCPATSLYANLLDSSPGLMHAGPSFQAIQDRPIPDDVRRQLLLDPVFRGNALDGET